MTFAFVPVTPAVSRAVSFRAQAHTSTTQLAVSAFVPKRARHSPSAARPVQQLSMTKGAASDDKSNGKSVGKSDDKPTTKELAKLYGGSYLGTSIGLSLVSYVVLYFMIAAGVDVRALVNGFGDFLATTPVGRPSVLGSVSDSASTATLAYIAHKATSPLRFPLTVAATPVVAKVFGRKDGSSGADSS